LPESVVALLPDCAATIAALHDMGKVSPGFQKKYFNEHLKSVTPRLAAMPKSNFETNHAAIGAAAAYCRDLSATAEYAINESNTSAIYTDWRLGSLPELTNFLGMTEKTRVNPSGYRVDVSNAAKRGFYLGTPLPGIIKVDETNNVLIIKNNSRVSDPIELRKDNYTLGSLAKTIQNRLMEDKALGRRKLQVREEEGRLKIISGTFGNSSTIDVEPGPDKDLSSLGLTDGISTPGEDVAGSIGNVEATGRGQLLVGAKDSNTDGLRLFVTLSEDDLVDEQEATVNISKGVAVKLGHKLDKLNDPLDGNVKRATDDITGQMKSFDEQISLLNKRADTKQTRLQRKFAKLDSTMGRLKSQQSYMTQQLSAMSGARKS